MSSEEVVLEIEGTSVKCKKAILISNSEYFRAMFEGNFIEKNKTSIHLQDVSLIGMNIILKLIWDETLYIEDTDVLSVLQTACMLQFEKIRSICIDKVVQILAVKNCLKIWIITEQLDLKPIYLKAKSMALIDFMIIKETDSILELSLQQLRNYLGSIYLRTDNELSVFQTAMKWWYEHNDKSIEELLSCINFRSLPSDHFKEILTYPGIVKSDIETTLKCLYNILNKINYEAFPKEIVDKAMLLSITKDRFISDYPCILVKSKSLENENSTKHGEISKIVFVFDDFLRKRSCEVLESNPTKNNGLHVLYLDRRLNEFRMFFSLFKKLEGFKLMGYKEYVFIYGGEYTIGRGDWNKGFWAYDTIRKKWQRKSALPVPRRHFESCIIGSKIFIVGGIGLYRIHQENLFWYDFKDDTWSSVKSLPLSDRQIKCCQFLDKLFLFSSTNRCGYLLSDSGNWISIPVKVDKEILDDKLEFSIFSYKNKLYIRGRKLIELVFTHNQLLIGSIKDMTNTDYIKIETVVSNNLAFTLYNICEKYTGVYYKNLPKPSRFSLEKYNLDNGDTEFIFENINIIQTEDKSFTINETLNLFLFSHYSIMDNEDLINDKF